MERHWKCVPHFIDWSVQGSGVAVTAPNWGAVIFTQQFDTPCRRTLAGSWVSCAHILGWLSDGLPLQQGCAWAHKPLLSAGAIACLQLDFTCQGMKGPCGKDISWGQMLLLACSLMRYREKGHWISLEFMSGRKVWLEGIPKILMAQKVLGSRHSLHRDLLRKGFMGLISSVCTSSVQVWQSPTCLSVNTTESSWWTLQKAHVFHI